MFIIDLLPDESRVGKYNGWRIPYRGEIEFPEMVLKTFIAKCSQALVSSINHYKSNIIKGVRRQNPTRTPGRCHECPATSPPWHDMSLDSLTVMADTQLSARVTKIPYRKCKDPTISYC